MEKWEQEEEREREALELEQEQELETWKQDQDQKEEFSDKFYCEIYSDLVEAAMQRAGVTLDQWDAMEPGDGEELNDLMPDIDIFDDFDDFVKECTEIIENYFEDMRDNILEKLTFLRKNPDLEKFLMDFVSEEGDQRTVDDLVDFVKNLPEP